MSSSVPPGPPGPEYLDAGGGQPLPPTPGEPGAGRRRAVFAGVAVVALAGVGGAAWALTAFLASGPQPAEALPASTIAYASIDLDPSGAQKIEAVRTLRKFPAFREEIGLDTDDDVRRKIWDESGIEDGCDGVSYEDDVEPWLGDRGAVAAVDTGDDMPAPVFVLQVTDEDAADEGLTALQGCATTAEGDADGGWAIADGWVVIAETDEVAQGVADDAAEGSLADDSTYQQWMDEVGDAGIMTAYVAPAAGEFMADGLEDLTGLFGGGEDYAASSGYLDPDTGEWVEEEVVTDTMTDDEVPDEVDSALRDFKGMAMTMRFDDGAMELEMAGDPGVTEPSLYGSDQGAEMVQTLPEDTAVAIGVGFADGWFGDALDRFASYAGDGTTADDLIAEAEEATGLDLPDDVETLFGDSFALALSSDFDPEAFFEAPDPSGFPVAAKIQGDPDGISAVLDKLLAQLPPEEGKSLLGTDSEGDVIVIGPSSDYRERVLADGGLGDTDTFQNVIREADQASAVIYVDFDAGDEWLADLVDEGDAEAADNVRVLQGFGATAWSTDDAAHAVLRLTTDD